MSGGERFSSTYDLVEQMFYLYVRVVKAKDLPPSTLTSSFFAFSKDRIQSSILEVFVKDKDMVGRDDYLGRVIFDLNEVPTRVPPDSPLAPQWYRLEDRRGDGKVRGDIMLAVWMGTQADEAFSDAWHADAASVYGEGVFNIRSKVYVSPKLWYLRVNAIEAQDVIPSDRNRLPELFVKGQVGNQVLRTRICPTRTTTPVWNEDLVFVAAEPFEEQLTITVEDHITLPMTLFEKRLDHRPVHSRWFNLEKYGFGMLEADRRKELKFSSRIHLRICLEGGYHVMDESTMYMSDQRPTARQLWKQPIGILEVGILGAQGLLPMKMKDSRGSTDAYCVAKYSQKWNEQYTWEVYDPCTVITLGVFDNCHLGSNAAARDSRIGKVNQVDNLRYQAMNIVATRLGRAEPPLRKEVVEYMLDVDSHMWSMRRSKANFFRIMSLFSGMITMGQWFNQVCHWKNPISSVLVHILFLILIWYPELMLPTLFLYMFFIGLWNYRFRPRNPPHMDTKLSWAEAVHPDELDEGERFQSLLSWRDTRATSLFIVFSFCSAVVLYATPPRVVALVTGLYYLRHPRFRSKLPSVPSNFFKRLPARTDSML
ncbi:hypothetical protein Ahy_A08g040315 isoform A [Arachis hypogaea]|uniref:C2 domain-containing protein n=1 Tax=Arachis hypogaea TaxID=3818 RepID=A0A445BYY2_ARAHY|nr:hypothetical protein Ahy_A08g040315 isoform A [Arachis hypogaea]